MGRTISLTSTCHQPFERIVALAKTDPEALIRAALGATDDGAEGLTVRHTSRIARSMREGTLRFEVGSFTGDRTSGRVPVSWTCADGLSSAPGFTGRLAVYPESATHCELSLSGRVVPAESVVGKVVAATVGRRSADGVAQRLVDGLVKHLDQLEAPSATEPTPA